MNVELRVCDNIYCTWGHEYTYSCSISASEKHQLVCVCYQYISLSN